MKMKNTDIRKTMVRKNFNYMKNKISVTDETNQVYDKFCFGAEDFDCIGFRFRDRSIEHEVLDEFEKETLMNNYEITGENQVLIKENGGEGVSVYYFANQLEPEFNELTDLDCIRGDQND